MQLTNYRITDTLLTLVYDHQIIRHIYLNEYSGKIVTRKKVGALTIQHPGIYLGVDPYTNNPVILHNHYKIFGTAGISDYHEYAQGKQVTFVRKPCPHYWIKVIENGLQQVIRQQPYDLLNYNCQTTTNEACEGRRYSNDVNFWVGAATFVGLGLLIVNAE